VHESFTSDLARIQFAEFGMITCDEVGVNFFFGTLPGFKVVELTNRSRCSHPFDGLVVGHKPNIRLLYKFVDKLTENFLVEFGFEPGGMEIDTEWSSV